MNDVRLRMTVIQENEINQLRSLTDLLHLEMNYIEQYMHVLREVKDGWVDEYVYPSRKMGFTLT